MERLIHNLRRSLTGTTLYNYLFIAFLLLYNYLFRDLILDTSIGAVYSVRKAPAFGIMILAMIILGIYGLLMKTRELRHAGVRSAGGPVIGICVLNWVVVISMAFTALQSFGIKVTEQSDKLSGFENGVIAATIFTAIIQGLAAFGFLIRMSEPYDKPVGGLKRAAGALASFAYSCIAYTVVWETIETNSMSRTGAFDLTTGEGVVNLIGWLICFLLLYPPMRIPFILQESHELRMGRHAARILISYAVVLMASMVPIIKNPFR